MRCRSWYAFGRSEKRIVCSRTSSHFYHARKIGNKLYTWQDGVGGIEPLELKGVDDE